MTETAQRYRLAWERWRDLVKQRASTPRGLVKHVDDELDARLKVARERVMDLSESLRVELHR